MSKFILLPCKDCQAFCRSEEKGKGWCHRGRPGIAADGRAFPYLTIDEAAVGCFDCILIKEQLHQNVAVCLT